jgi:hypothetical protein
MKNWLFILALFFIAPTALKYPGSERFAVAQLKYAGNWDNRTDGVKALMIELMNRTSINAELLPRPVKLSDRELFYCPFLLLTGDRAFPAFTAAERAALRLYLETGGFLLIDNSSGARDGDFDKSVRREMGALFPDKPLKTLDVDHSIYRSFYLMNKTYFGGRVKTAPYLEGITIDDMTPVVYSMNDAAGAWQRDLAGNFIFDAIPGGEMQRRDAFKFGVNAVLYALTANYKKDAVHVRALLKRKRR